MSHRTLAEGSLQFTGKVRVAQVCVLHGCQRKSLGGCGEVGSSALLIGISQSVLSDLYFIRADQGHVCCMVLNS